VRNAKQGKDSEKKKEKKEKKEKKRKNKKRDAHCTLSTSPHFLMQSFKSKAIFAPLLLVQKIELGEFLSHFFLPTFKTPLLFY
jgi:hypothetical protein